MTDDILTIGCEKTEFRVSTDTEFIFRTALPNVLLIFSLSTVNRCVKIIRPITRISTYAAPEKQFSPAGNVLFTLFLSVSLGGGNQPSICSVNHLSNSAFMNRTGTLCESSSCKDHGNVFKSPDKAPLKIEEHGQKMSLNDLPRINGTIKPFHHNHRSDPIPSDPILPDCWVGSFRVG